MPPSKAKKLLFIWDGWMEASVMSGVLSHWFSSSFTLY